jgi:hypothetical protein
VDLCPPCHDTVHALFTNDELIERYHTVEDLQSADRLEDYLDWALFRRGVARPIRSLLKE